MLQFFFRNIYYVVFVLLYTGHTVIEQTLHFISFYMRTRFLLLSLYTYYAPLYTIMLIFILKKIYIAKESNSLFYLGWPTKSISLTSCNGHINIVNIYWFHALLKRYIMRVEMLDVVCILWVVQHLINDNKLI